MFQIKSRNEDFIVRENIHLSFNENGKYGYFLLWKNGLNTIEVVDKLSKVLGQRQISYAGLKDKNALTYQYISIYKPNLEKIKNLNLKNIKLEFIGYGNTPIFLGQLDCNSFMITVRNLDYRYKEINFIENYFDEQRFSKNNVEIGRYIIKRNYNFALKLMNLNGDINLLRKQDIGLLRFYVNAYQSYLWNLVVSDILKDYKNSFKLGYSLGEFIFLRNKVRNFRVPILNFDSEFKNKTVEEAYNRIMDVEKISNGSFLIREIPELVNESVERDAFVNVKIKSRFMEDELNKGKFKQILEFNLPKGSYGTILVKKMFSSRLNK